MTRMASVFALLFMLLMPTVAQQNPPPRPPGGGQPPNNDAASVEVDDDVIQVTLDYSEYSTFGAALADQIIAGDGNGIDNFFRNSGVVIDEEANTYYAVNGVHPVNQGDYTSYYPKSIVEASLEDDTIVRAYSFDNVNGHDIDMEALTFAESPDYLYVGDEYNFIYELDLESGEITREWNLADIGVSVNVDKGIEAMTYSPETQYFYVGIQETGAILVVDVSLDEGETVEKIDEFQLLRGWAPSGLFAHADGTLYIISMSGGGQAGSQMIFRYETDGTLLCTITIPADLGLTRPDGIYLDSADEYLYIVDSQGPIYDGWSLYRVAWNDPCN